MFTFTLKVVAMVVKGDYEFRIGVWHCSAISLLNLAAEEIITELHINDRSPGWPIHWAPESWLKSRSQPFSQIRCWIVLKFVRMFQGKHRGGGVCGGQVRYLQNVGNEFVVGTGGGRAFPAVLCQIFVICRSPDWPCPALYSQPSDQIQNKLFLNITRET